MKSVNRAIQKEKNSYNLLSPMLLGKLNDLKTIVDKEIKAFDGEIWGDFAQEKREVDTFWYDKYKTVFRDGFGAKVSKMDRFGDVTPPEQIIQSLILSKQNGSEALAQYNRMFENTPEAMDILNVGLLDILHTKIPKHWFSEDVIRKFKSAN